MRNPILSGFIVLMLLGLMIYIGDITYGTNGQNSEEYLSVPGVCKAPQSFLQSLVGGLSSAPSWLQNSGSIISSQLKDMTAIFPDPHMASAIIGKDIRQNTALEQLVINATPFLI